MAGIARQTNRRTMTGEVLLLIEAAMSAERPKKEKRQ